MSDPRLIVHTTSTDYWRAVEALERMVETSDRNDLRAFLSQLKASWAVWKATQDELQKHGL